MNAFTVRRIGVQAAGRIEPNAKLQAEGKPVNPGDAGDAGFGIDLEQPTRHHLCALYREGDFNEKL